MLFAEVRFFSGGAITFYYTAVVQKEKREEERKGKFGSVKKKLGGTFPPLLFFWLWPNFGS